MFRSILAALALVAATASAQAQDANARVVVPDLPGGALVSGCYRADRGLYGPYQLTFCLERRGTYQVRGNGLRCDGRLDWKTEGRDVTVSLRRQSCNRNLAWAAATVTCRPRDLLDIILSELFGNRPRQDGRVVVPDNPQVRQLRCTYIPTVPGERRVSFVARRG